MRPAYTCTIPPTTEPVSVLEACAHLRADNDSELLLVQGYVAAAREFIEGQTGRALMTSTWTRVSPRFVDRSEDCYGRVSYIERTPLASVVSVKYYDESDVQQTLSSTVYGVVTSATPGFIYLKANQSWPALYDRPDAVEITFTAGAASVSAVPPTLRNAVMQLAAHLYEQRQPVNVGNIVNEIPFGLRTMIDHNRVGWWIA